MGLLAALGVALAACSDESAAPPPTTDVARPDPLVVDWAARTVAGGRVDGFAVGFCEGDAPFVCVSEDGRHVGVVELLRFDAEVLAPFDGDLEAFARDHYRTVADDRAAGCGDGYRIEGDDPAPTVVAGEPGIRYSFGGFRGDDLVERSVVHAAATADSLVLLNAAAYDPDGCIGSEGAEFAPADVQRFEPTLRRLAASSVIGPATVDEQELAGYLTAIDAGGTVVLDEAELLVGDEAERVARESGAIGASDDLDTDFFVHDPDTPLRTLRLSGTTVVRLYDCAAGCSLRDVPVADFLDGSVQPFGGARALFVAEVIGDEVVALTEQYVP